MAYSSEIHYSNFIMIGQNLTEPSSVRWANWEYSDQPLKVLTLHGEIGRRGTREEQQERGRGRGALDFCTMS